MTDVKLKKCKCGKLFYQDRKHRCNGCIRLRKELVETYHYIRRKCYDPTRHNYNSIIHREMSPKWLQSPWEFYYYVHDHLGPRPSSNHYITLIDSSGDYVEGNIRWITKAEHVIEKYQPTGLMGSPTYSDWQTMKNDWNKGVVSRWEDFRLFLEDVGSRPEGGFYYRPDPSKPYGPDNFEWRTYDRSAGSDYKIWWSRKYNYPGSMCEEWESDYVNFLRDMGDRPRGAKLRRYDLTRPASPDNAYWSTN